MSTCEFAFFCHNLLKFGHWISELAWEPELPVVARMPAKVLSFMLLGVKMILETLLLFLLTASTFLWFESRMASLAAELLLAKNVLMAVMESTRKHGTVSECATRLLILFKPKDMKHRFSAKVSYLSRCFKPLRTEPSRWNLSGCKHGRAKLEGCSLSLTCRICHF